ncbi:CsbD family protein [Arthrobacter sp.]|uniref:CsbD family protein n=1 Tax=Arthrobacter sp. TaxID=1667 RepID=UPI0035C70C58
MVFETKVRISGESSRLEDGHVDERRNAMGADEKAQNNAEKLGGKIQEGLGKATGNRDMEAEGQKDQSKANLKNAGENIKDAFKK